MVAISACLKIIKKLVDGSCGILSIALLVESFDISRGSVDPCGGPSYLIFIITFLGIIFNLYSFLEMFMDWCNVPLWNCAEGNDPGTIDWSETINFLADDCMLTGFTIAYLRIDDGFWVYLKLVFNLASILLYLYERKSEELDDEAWVTLRWVCVCVFLALGVFAVIYYNLVIDDYVCVSTHNCYSLGSAPPGSCCGGSTQSEELMFQQGSFNAIRVCETSSGFQLTNTTNGCVPCSSCVAEKCFGERL